MRECRCNDRQLTCEGDSNNIHTHRAYLYRIEVYNSEFIALCVEKESQQFTFSEALVLRIIMLEDWCIFCDVAFEQFTCRILLEGEDEKALTALLSITQ